jgi:hypothetical protein
VSELRAELRGLRQDVTLSMLQQTSASTQQQSQLEFGWMGQPCTRAQTWPDVW